MTTILSEKEYDVRLFKKFYPFNYCGHKPPSSTDHISNDFSGCTGDGQIFGNINLVTNNLVTDNLVTDNLVTTIW